MSGWISASAMLIMAVTTDQPWFQMLFSVMTIAFLWQATRDRKVLK